MIGGLKGLVAFLVLVAVTGVLFSVLEHSDWESGWLFVRSNGPTSGHSTTWLMILAQFYLTIALFARIKPWHGAVITASVFTGMNMFFHEGLWFIFYFLAYGFPTSSMGILKDFFYTLILGAALVMYCRMFGRPSLGFLSLISVYVGYLIVWFLTTGFAITININEGLAGAPFRIANASPLVNGLEIGGWAVTTAIFICYAYIISRRTRGTN